MVREVGGRPRDLDCHGVLGGSRDTAGVVEVVGLGLICFPWGSETTLPNTTRTVSRRVKPCCQQADVLSLDVIGPTKLERTLA